MLERHGEFRGVMIGTPETFLQAHLFTMRTTQ
jgi:hypothetical protein